MDSAQQTAMPRMNRLLKNSSNTNIRLPPLPVLFPVYASGQKMVKKGGPAFRRAASQSVEKAGMSESELHPTC